MSMLFVFFFWVCLLEILLQFFWVAGYFRFGLPILKLCISGDLNTRFARVEKYSSRSVNQELFLVCQENFIGRTAYHHGIIKLARGSDKDTFDCIFYVDWNVLLLGGFLACLVLGYGIFQYFFGIGIAYLFSGWLISLKKKGIQKMFEKQISNTP